MRRELIHVSLVLLVCASPLVIAQSKPDFGGTWVTVRYPELMKGFVTPDVETLTLIKQSSMMLSASERFISKTTGAPLRQIVPVPPTILYLDGHERRSAQSDGSVRTTCTFWDGEVLVTRIVTSRKGRPAETRIRKWYLDRAGMLVVELILGDGKDPYQARDFMILKRR